MKTQRCSHFPLYSEGHGEDDEHSVQCRNDASVRDDSFDEVLMFLRKTEHGCQMAKL